MRILLETVHDDVHAAAVAWRLERDGHSVSVLHLGDFPARQTVSLRIGQTVGATVCGPAGAVFDEGFDAAVIRRRGGYNLSPDLNGLDRPFVERDVEVTGRSYPFFSAEQTFWINPPRHREFSELKPVQLRLAALSGLITPDTLISNDVDDVLDFCARQGGVVAFKPLTPVGWHGAEGAYAYYTTKVSLTELQARREQIALTPAIYQQYIEKAYELRVVVMGRTAFAARLDTQAHELTRVDWRAGEDLGVKYPITPIDLIPELLNGCRGIMARLGLVFGVFDFAVDRDGVAYFLEVNPMGQFLWLEHQCPDFPLLEAFCEFILARDPDWVWRPEGRSRCDGFAAFNESDGRRRFAERMKRCLPAVPRFVAQVE